MSGHSRQTPALQLRGSQHRDFDEVKDSHARRWGDHRAAAHGMPKEIASGIPTVTTAISANRNRRRPSRSCSRHRVRRSDHRASSVESVARASGADRPAELLGINPHLGIALVRGKAGSGLGAQESVTD